MRLIATFCLVSVCAAAVLHGQQAAQRPAAARGTAGSPLRAETQLRCLTVGYKCDAKCPADSHLATSKPAVGQQYRNCGAICHAVAVEQCNEAGTVLIKRQDDVPTQTKSGPVRCGLLNNPLSHCSPAK
jgi:hypothetical protein